MIWTTLSPWITLLGWLGLAGLLFALQRLRVRHRRVEVVTTQFWREALEESRARVLTDRFRHPWAFALVLALVSLIWLAVAGPRLDTSEEAHHVFLLDLSAGMTPPGKLERALEVARERLERLPPGSRELHGCGADARQLLRPDEELPLLEERTRALRAESVPPSVDRVLARLARRTLDRDLHVVVIGGAPVSRDTLDGLPDRVKVSRLPLELETEKLPTNHGVTAAGLAPAASGAPDRVDVLFTITGPTPEEIAVRVELEGSPISLDGASGTRRGDSLQYLVSDLPGQGQGLVISIDDAGGLEVDDRVRLVLPRREPLRVSWAGTRDASLLEVLEADPEVEVVESGGQIEIRTAPATRESGGTLPALVIAPREDREHAFEARVPGEAAASETAIRDLLEELALDRVDGALLARETGAVISLGLSPGEVRELSVWQELIESPSFRSSAAFPLFFSLALRWLADRDEPLAFATAGELPPTGDELPLMSGTTWLAGAGAPFPLPEAGSYRTRDVEPLEVLLTSPSVTRDVAGGAPGTSLPELEPFSAGPPILAWLISAAMGLLALEWWLSRRGAIP